VTVGLHLQLNKCARIRISAERQPTQQVTAV